MSKLGFLDFNVQTGKMIPGQDHVARGHQHLCGWNVPQSYPEAVKHYSKAAKLKNPEGMYNLAMCYHYGNGVEQDVQKALGMYREISAMDRNTLEQTTPLKCNVGVAEAQHNIGLMYHEGTGVDRDYILAASWYKKAMENGVAQSANNLGILHFFGLGMPKNEKMAELCWKQAVILKDVNAPASLFIYYLNEMEPDKALDMLRIGREMGNSGLLYLPDVEFNRLVEQVKLERLELEPDLIKFEKANNLDIKGLTFSERLTRRTHHFLDQIPSLTKFKKLFEQANGEEQAWGGKAQAFSMQNICTIYEKASQGSVTASQIIKTLTLSSKLNKLLDAYKEVNEKLAMEIINHLYNIVTLDSHLFWVSDQAKLKSVVGRLFKEKCDAKGDDDMKIRLCHVLRIFAQSLKSEDMYSVEVIKEGIRRYPNNQYYYKYLAEFFGLKKMHKEGRIYAEMGLKLFPENVDLLYSYAVLLRLENATQGTELQIVEAYKKFISAAPPDHRKVPEAYYQISNLLLGNMVRYQKIENSSEKMEQIMAYFHWGEVAETSQLPCYLPYGESPIKLTVAMFLTMIQPTRLLQAMEDFESEKGQETPKTQAYLTSPTRKAVVLFHRQNLQKVQREIGGLKDPRFMTTVSPKLTQTVVKTMSVVSAISLQEMNPTEDHIYENRVLNLTIVDELNGFYPSIHLIAEDDNGDVTRLYIYNVEKDEATLENFQPGCRLAIINPYMRIGAQDITNGIRNDEPKCLVFLKKVENMCRFCGKGNASHRCSRCRHSYCSKECQRLDWEELNHKAICSLK